MPKKAAKSEPEPEYRPWVSEEFLRGAIGEMLGPATEQFNHEAWRDLAWTAKLIQEAAESLRRADNVKHGFDEAGTDRLA